jgi:hypothetical protein
MSNKRDNFIRLAENRVNRAIKDIRLLGNLANRSNYSYKSEDVNKIIKVLTSELNEMKNKFSKGDRASITEFKL